MARLGLIVALALALPFLVASQSATTSGRSPNATPTATVTTIVTSVPVVTRTSVSGSSTFSFTSLSTSSLVSTLSPSPTSTASSNGPNNTSTGHNSTATQDSGPVLDTHIGPAFGVLGALLLLTGLPSAFLGHKNRWSSFFLMGFYTLSLVCLALILKFGVLVAVHPPQEKLRGLFVLACGVAGFAGGGVSIFFWQQTKYFIGAWGGFSIGLWVQCFRSGGLIGPIGFRWIMYSACATIGFVLCTIPKLHYHIMILGTAFTGASAFMLGVDCFTTAGLKEFYVYNIGFSALFPKFDGIRFPVSQTMQIEIGLIAAVALAGAAVQLRVLRILKRKLLEINEEEKRQEAVAEEKAVMRFEHVQRDMDEWEKEHGPGTSKPMSESELSAVPLMAKEQDDAPSTPGGSTTAGHQRTRTRSGLSEYAYNNESSRPVSRFSQSPGILPAMNLGDGLDSQLPTDMMSDGLRFKDADLMKKEELLAEIQTIRRSIDALRSETGSTSGESRRPSMSLHSRTLSGDLAVAQAHAATSRAGPSRDRVHSMNILGSPFEETGARAAEGAAIGRPVSAPLRDDDWEAYVRERKLFQPPSGPSAPIAPTLVTPIPQPASVFKPISDSVAQALADRRQRESTLEFGLTTADDLPIGAKRASRAALVDVAPQAHRRTSSLGPVKILPPRQKRTAEPQPAPRTVTYEELLERHQAKMRSLQDPISRQEKEQADLSAARGRWERSKATERELQARKQTEKEAALTKKPKEKEEHRRSRDLLGEGLSRPSGGRRVSAGKVLDWQKYQQEAGNKEMDAPKEPSSRRRAHPAEQGGLPFPNTTPRGASTGDKRRSRSGIPPN